VYRVGSDLSYFYPISYSPYSESRVVYRVGSDLPYFYPTSYSPYSESRVVYRVGSDLPYFYPTSYSSYSESRVVYRVGSDLPYFYPTSYSPYSESRVVYRVGRSMFETERLPLKLAAYAENVDEVRAPSQPHRRDWLFFSTLRFPHDCAQVLHALQRFCVTVAGRNALVVQVWVPSSFNVRSFQLAGVSTEKTFILPQVIMCSGKTKKKKLCVGGVLPNPVPKWLLFLI